MTMSSRAGPVRVEERPERVEPLRSEVLRLVDDDRVERCPDLLGPLAELLRDRLLPPLRVGVVGRREPERFEQTQSQAVVRVDDRVGSREQRRQAIGHRTVEADHRGPLAPFERSAGPVDDEPRLAGSRSALDQHPWVGVHRSGGPQSFLRRRVDGPLGGVVVAAVLDREGDVRPYGADQHVDAFGRDRLASEDLFDRPDRIVEVRLVDQELLRSVGPQTSGRRDDVGQHGGVGDEETAVACPRLSASGPTTRTWLPNPVRVGS